MLNVESMQKQCVLPSITKLKADIAKNIDLTQDELKTAHFCFEFITYNQVHQLTGVLEKIIPTIPFNKRTLVIGRTNPMLILVIQNKNMAEIKTISGIPIVSLQSEQINWKGL